VIALELPGSRVAWLEDVRAGLPGRFRHSIFAQSKDQDKTKGVTKAMPSLDKLHIAALERAYHHG